MSDYIIVVCCKCGRKLKVKKESVNIGPEYKHWCKDCVKLS